MKRKCTSRLVLLNPRVLIGFALYAAGLVFAFGAISSAAAGDAVAAEPGRWIVTGSMAAGREYHTATLLPNGQVLVSGGNSAYGVLAGAELYKSAP